MATDAPIGIGAVYKVAAIIGNQVAACCASRTYASASRFEN